MAKLGTLTLTGQSGQTYDFDVYPASTKWADNVGCVYYISKRTVKSNGHGNHSAIYVGETEDLKARLANHHKQSCFDNHNYNAVSIHKISGANARQTAESDLIASMRLPCND